MYVDGSVFVIKYKLMDPIVKYNPYNPHNEIYEGIPLKRAITQFVRATYQIQHKRTCDGYLYEKKTQTFKIKYNGEVTIVGGS